MFRIRRNLTDAERKDGVDYIRAMTIVSAMQAAESLLYSGARTTFHDTMQSDASLVSFMDATKRLALSADTVVGTCSQITPPSTARNFHMRIGEAYSTWCDWAWSLVGAVSGDSLGNPTNLMARFNSQLARGEKARLRLLHELAVRQDEIQIVFNEELHRYISDQSGETPYGPPPSSPMAEVVVLTPPSIIEGIVSRVIESPTGGLWSERFDPETRSWTREGALPVVDVDMDGRPLRPEEIAAWGIPD